MAHAADFTDLDEIAAGCGVVEVIGKRVFHRFWHNQASGEVDNARDPVGLSDCPYALHIAGIAFDERDIGWGRVPTTRREIIENDDLAACCAKGQDGVAADVARTSGDENGHGIIQRAILALPSRLQVSQRLDMGVDQISHVDAITNTGAIRRLIILTEDGDGLTFADHSLAGHLD